MSNRFVIKDKFKKKTVDKNVVKPKFKAAKKDDVSKAAEDFSQNSEIARPLKPTAVPVAEPIVMSANSMEDNVINLEGRHSAFMYIPVTLKNADQAWERVIDAMRTMDTSDFNVVEEEDEEATYDCYSLKYTHESYVLARTRLVRLEEKKEKENLFIELRKLEGDGFAFTDDFQKHLEKELEDITIPDGRPEPQPKPEAMFLDLADASLRGETVHSWMTSLRPEAAGNTLVYNDVEAYKAMSTIGWNLKSPENFEALKVHAKQLIEYSLNLLNATPHLPTAYFAAVALNEFAKKNEFAADWGQIKLMSNAIDYWSQDSESAILQVSRSREVVRLLCNTIVLVGPTLGEEGKKDAEMTIVIMMEKLQELSNNKDYDGFINVDEINLALSM